MSLDEGQKIRALFIIEVAGRPPEHLTETLKKIVEKMKEEKDLEVKSEKVNKPAPMKNQKDFYTNFVEVEIECGDIQKLLFTIFRYMPAHIEIISPENIRLTNDGLGAVLNELTRRLHGYDEIARVIQVEKNILEKKLKAMLEEKKPKDKKEKK
jgi:hypothetical protein